MFQRQPNNLDELNRTLLITGLICTIISAFFFQAGSIVKTVISVIAAGALIYAVIRMFAGNPDKRYRENMKFLTVVTGVKDWFAKVFRTGGTKQPKQAKQAKTASTGEKPRRAHKARKNPSWSEIKQYKYFICPQCAQRLRVPRGKGKLRVTCTHCGNVFETKS